ncbi:hypothetical protein [Seonamhaeicola sp.]|uniref:hypothetical protein n=1 Tax=Seonamhaeicola sp. TaxID=1912245 RepID=UPI00261F21FC|nr:hypothetical protein [Seonamhaeicola sp.]
MKKQHILFLPVLLALFLFAACEKNEDGITVSKINYVSFEPAFNFGVDPTGTATEQISIFVSTITSAARTFNISVVEDGTTADPTGYSISSSTITIPADSNEGAIELTVTGSKIDPDGSVLILEISSQEGLLIGEPLVINLSQVCPYPETILDITFDDYPEEQYWQILDANDVVLFEGGPYPDQTSFSKALCLPPGSYQILMGDLFGDGGGPYTLTYNGNVIVARNGDHESGEVIAFQIN